MKIIREILSLIPLCVLPPGAGNFRCVVTACGGRSWVSDLRQYVCYLTLGLTQITWGKLPVMYLYLL